MRRNYILDLILRYSILLILSINGLFLFYFIFTPLTVYPVFAILNIFLEPELINKTTIILNSIPIEIIPACIAGSAYYLLTILNLTTPMDYRKRIKSISFLLGSFLILNVLRIVLFSVLFIYDYNYFDLTHQATWYLGSTIIVILLWFSNVKIFNIKKIPAYSDLSKLIKQTK